MTAEDKKLHDQLEAIARSAGPTELNAIWLEFIQRKDMRIRLQKEMLALSFGFNLSGQEQGAQHFYNAAGYIEGLNARIEQQELEYDNARREQSAFSHVNQKRKANLSEQNQAVPQEEKQSPCRFNEREEPNDTKR